MAKGIEQRKTWRRRDYSRTVQRIMQRAVWPERMNNLFKGGREIPWGSGLGPGGKDRGHRDEKCELYSRDMKFFKLSGDKYTQWDIWKDLKVRAGRTLEMTHLSTYFSQALGCF